MYLLRTFIYCFVISCFLLFSCNSASDPDATSESAEYRHLENFEVNPESEYKDPYWDNPAIGADPTEKTNLLKKFNNLLVFHVDDTMEVKTVYTATLALARNAAIGPLKIKVLEESVASGDDVLVDTTIELGKRMKANLKDISPKDEKSFEIDPLGTDEQNLSKTKESYWQWSIEPKKEGPHKLILSIQVILSDDDKINLPARNIPIMIYSKKVPFMSKVGSFFSNYWQWLITAILLPIMIALLTNSLKQRGEKKKQQKV
jgi:hypothetical protein